MYKVLLISDGKESGRWILSQTKGGKGISKCGKYRFYVNEDIEDPDFVIIMSKSSKEELTFNVAPENVILTTSEPYTVLAYPRDYCDQFGLVCSCQEQLKHRNVKFTPAILFWFAGVRFDSKGNPTPLKDYDFFKAAPTPEKTKLISVVSSTKAFTQGHVERIRFVERLKEHYGDKIDLFGRGYNGFGDKCDVVNPYKYHIVIENSSTKYYWTEKLADCYICESYPIYYGCTNVGDYFPEGSYSTIDIHDFEGAVKTIDALIATDSYEKAKPLLKECKDKVLDEYNLFNYLAAIMDDMDPTLPRRKVTIKPCKSMHDMHNVYNYLIGRTVFKMRRFFYRLFHKGSMY
jgi:hypothetical protein